MFIGFYLTLLKVIEYNDFWDEYNNDNIIKLIPNLFFLKNLSISISC